jgi:hypothetical protein
MTQDEVIEMAKQAGLWPAVTDTFPKELEAFAKLIAQHEREACAEFVDSVELPLVAMLIRARGQA